MATVTNPPATESKSTAAGRKVPSSAAVSARDRQLRTIWPIACFLLVTLRLFIGWQFLYEGLWKYDSMSSPTPWTAEGYLVNAQGPFRDTFRDMTGDPDGLSWLDYGSVAAKMDRFRTRFVRHYRPDEAQQKKLDELIDGVSSVTVPIRLPDGVRVPSVASYKDGRLTVSLDEPLLGSEISKLKSQVPFSKNANGLYVYSAEGEAPVAAAKAEDTGAPAEMIAYYKSLERLDALQARGLGYKRRAAASLKGDPDRVGVVASLDDEGTKYRPVMETIKAEEASAKNTIIRYGEIEVYKDLLSEYEGLVTSKGLQFKQDHAVALAGKVRQKKAELVNPVTTMFDEMAVAAQKILKPEQLSAGALPPERNQLWASSQQAMWGLLILGSLLVLGLFTPFAALGGAVMLLSFYLVIPPWPGVPPAPGPEHSFIVNKNLIEVVALLAIAAMPTGRWFGLDGVVARLFGRKKVAA